MIHTAFSRFGTASELGQLQGGTLCSDPPPTGSEYSTVYKSISELKAFETAISKAADAIALIGGGLFLEAGT